MSSGTATIPMTTMVLNVPVVTARGDTAWKGTCIHRANKNVKCITQFLDPSMHAYTRLDGYTVGRVYNITWGSLCGNSHRHRWSTPCLVDSSDGHRVSSVGAQVVKCVWVNSLEQVIVLCSAGIHIVEGELQTHAVHNKTTVLAEVYSADVADMTDKWGHNLQSHSIYVYYACIHNSNND